MLKTGTMGQMGIVFGGDATAESILDRIIQNAITVFTGETNMRQLLSPHPPRPEQET